MTIEKDKDGTYIAYNVDESPYTLIGRGATVKEAKADFANSMQEIKESEEERKGKGRRLLFCRQLLRFASICLHCSNIIRC